MNIENIGQCQIIGKSYTQNLSQYQASDDYERISKTKDHQRDKILRFLLENSVGKVDKYTGLPGKYWAMERKLLTLLPNAHFSGFEKNPQIFYKALSTMPGRHKTISKSKYITDSIKLNIHVNNSGIYVLGDINSLSEKQMHSLLIKESGTFAFGFSARTMVWYDFTASFNEKTFRAIHDVKKITRKGSAICFTLQYGRDLYFNGQGEESRIEIIKKAFPEFECLDYWKYKGFNDTWMINICGIRKK